MLIGQRARALFLMVAKALTQLVEGPHISGTKIDAEVVDVKIDNSSAGVQNVSIGGDACADKVSIDAQQLLSSTIIGKNLTFLLIRQEKLIIRFSKARNLAIL